MSVRWLILLSTYDLECVCALTFNNNLRLVPSVQDRK